MAVLRGTCCFESGSMGYGDGGSLLAIFLRFLRFACAGPSWLQGSRPGSGRARQGSATGDPCSSRFITRFC